MLRHALPLCALLVLAAMPARATILLEARGMVQGLIDGGAIAPPGEEATIRVLSIDHGSSYSLDPLTGLPDGRSRVPTPIRLTKEFDPSTVPLLRALGNEENFDTFELSLYSASGETVLMRIELRNALILSHANSNTDGLTTQEEWTIAYERIRWVYLVGPTAYYEDLLSTRPGRLTPAPLPPLSPSPFEFALPADEPASLEILDHSRRLVCRLFDGVAGDGELVRWDGTDSFGQRVEPGLYLAELRSPRGVTTRRLAVAGRP